MSSFIQSSLADGSQPCNCGIGGDVFALFYDAKSKSVKAINGSGKSPAALTLDKLREKGIKGKRIPNEDINGATVPGAVAAWVDMLEAWGSGKLSRDEILKVCTSSLYSPIIGMKGLTE